MENPFDAAQKAAFNTVVNLMGYDAVWTPFASPSIPVNARVGKREPTEKEVLEMSIENSRKMYFMEYQDGFFTGLFESVANGNDETVEIDLETYYIQKITAVYDGLTYRALLQKQ